MDRRSFLKTTGAAAAGFTTGIVADRGHVTISDNTSAQKIARLHGGTGTSSIIWSVPTKEKIVAVTFDDGPTQRYTPDILDLLDRFSWQSTFFVMGL